VLHIAVVYFNPLNAELTLILLTWRIW